MRIWSCPQLGSQDLFPDCPGLSQVVSGGEAKDWFRHVAAWIAFLVLGVVHMIFDQCCGCWLVASLRSDGGCVAGSWDADSRNPPASSGRHEPSVIMRTVLDRQIRF